MKTGRFTTYDLRSTRANRERGIALVITLILLAVTLVMAIAFLAISRRESTSQSTTADAATAKFAADAALAKAEARIVSQILTTTNPYVFSLMVSTNYINPAGFTNTGPGVANLENVNYDHYVNSSTPLSGADLAQNIANLFYDPRPPVFYPSNDFRFYLDLNRNGQYDTNGLVVEMNNFGSAILNGSGAPIFSQEVGDPEWIGILEHPDQPHGPNNPFIARYCFIAVPANSLDINYIHNQARDLASGNNLNVNSDGYFRNQNVGTWEINLAAFLADLNTNIWDPQGFGNQYQFRQPNFVNLGFGFQDAYYLLASRYADSYSSQPSVQTLFGANGVNAFASAGIDAYTMGASQSMFDTNYPDPYYNNFWVGAENTNNFFTPDDLFNTTKTANFGTHLQNAGTNLLNAIGNAGTTVPTYDRYTFYRMLAQLGTDTSPAQGKINLNYQNAVVYYDTNTADGVADNIAATSITIIPNYETNFYQWRPQDFFTAAANQLLGAYSKEWFESSPSNYFQTYYGIVTNYNATTGYGLTNYPYFGVTNQILSFGITNIPVYVNGSFVYTPAVNRLLQLAANIYDSATDSNYPSVFRPIFWITNEYNAVLNESFTNVYIRGYQYIQELPGVVPTPVESAGGGVFNLAGTMFSTPAEVNDPSLPLNSYYITNLWGVPWIVGAKKAFPNFNGFELDNTFFIERKLQFTRSNNQPGQSRTYGTNQMYIMGISNAFAMDDWNSYATAYNNPVTIYAQDILSVGLTNSANMSVANLFSTNVSTATPYWPSGYFGTPFGTNITVMQNLSPPGTIPSTNNLYVYYFTPTPQTLNGYTFKGPSFIPTSLDPSNYLDTGTPPMPQFGVVATNHLQAFLLDTSGGNVHILDYVQLGSMNSSLDVNTAIADPDSDTTVNGDTGGLWSTNYYSGTVPFGVVEQYNVSRGDPFPAGLDSDEGSASTQTGWTTAPVPGLGNDASPAAQQAFFSAFFSSGDNAFYAGAVGGYVSNFQYSIQAPFTPMREIVQRFVFQANDPLVHYLSSDLDDFLDNKSNKVNIAAVQTNVITTIGKLSDRYLPWGNLSAPNVSPAANNQMPGTWNGIPVDNNAYNLSYKDPLVWTSDNWDFPTNKYPTVGWLGRVHRGTPWQSVYLKSTDIMSEMHSVSNGVQNQPEGLETWQVWTGNPNAQDAINEDPAQDRLLFDLFTAAPDDDATRGQVSVNIGADDPNNPLAGLASWSALLSGALEFSNNAPNLTVSRSGSSESPSTIYQESWPSYSIWTNQPMGIPTNNPMWQIVAGINSTRTNFPALDGLKGYFEHVGDILAVPQLSVASPYLSYDSLGNQVKHGISDEMYEWLPQQMMGLMTVSGTPQNPPRYVVYCYGQTLKPAPNGYVASPGQFFGLNTNYQVVAESAARVVLRVVNAPTPANPTGAPHVVVEQYNPLPPN